MADGPQERDATDVPPPSARTRSVRAQRKDETRQRLVEAARALFVARGYDETTYDELARRAGVARQTAFNHFPRKEDFVAAWVDERRDQLAEAIDRHAAGDEPAAVRLVLILRAMTDIYERMPDESRAFMRAWSRLGGPLVDKPVAADLFAIVVRDGQRSGAFVVDTDAETVGELIRAVYFDALWRWADPSAPPGGPSLFESLLAHLQIVLTGLCVDPDRAELRRSLRMARSIEAVRSP